MQAVLVVALVLPWLLLLGSIALVSSLVRQHGRTLVAQEHLTARLASLEQLFAGQGQAPVEPEGLAPGTVAPAFSLPTTEGPVRTLADYAGSPFVLAFWSPTCGFCSQMAPRLGDMPADALPFVLIANGAVEANASMAAEHGWTHDVLMDTAGDAFREYRSGGTPTGYLVAADGTIASPLAIGAEALLALSERADANGDANDPAGLERALEAGLRARDVSSSRINRDGLEAGTPAPEFELRDLDGETHTVDEFRGSPTLLVFSDPDCVPCQNLGPDLERIHRDAKAPKVVVLSRGDSGANREKAREHGLTMPILLQRGWEVSKRYGTFATPAAYLVDAEGVLAEPLAVGPDAILDLAGEAPAAKGGRRRRRAKAGR